VKALTILQPWAWAIVHGQKRIENRTWKTPYRGPLAIHAGQKLFYFNNGHDKPCEFPPKEQLVFGAIIGLCDLIDCLPAESVPANPFKIGPCCWILANVRPVKPYYCRGQQLLWMPPSEFLQQHQSRL